jgi:hypothetical protein
MLEAKPRYFMGKEPLKDIDMEVYFVTPHTLETY